MLKYASLMCALTLSAVVLCAQTGPIPTVETTAMVGIADAQTAQLNLLNPGVQSNATAAICTAAVSFIDANDAVIKTVQLSVPPGKSMSAMLRSDVDLSLVSGARREIRATITLPGLVPTAASAPACKLIPTLEIFDTITGKTLVTLGHVTRVPAVVATSTAP